MGKNEYLCTFILERGMVYLDLREGCILLGIEYSLFGVNMDKHFPMVYQNLFF